MLFYAYLFEHPDNKPDLPKLDPYVIYAMTKGSAHRKFERLFDKPGKLLKRETW